MPRMTQAEVDAYNARQKVSNFDGLTAIGEEIVNASEAVECERDLHNQILRECTRRRWITIHSRMDRRSTQGVGVPDFVVLANDGRVIICEAKRRLGKLSPAQQAFAHWAERLGHSVTVVRSFAAFLAIADQTSFTDAMVSARAEDV